MLAAARRCAIAGLCLLALGCGQKGPPRAPLRLIPAPVSELTARRVEDRARLRFVLPTRNANGPGPLMLDQIEIYAVTVAPGFSPPNRELMSSAYLVGQIPVRPAPIEGEPPPPEDDKRPGPGDTVTFDEDLTPAKLTPLTNKAWADAPVPPTAGPLAATPAPPPPVTAPAAPATVPATPAAAGEKPAAAAAQPPAAAPAAAAGEKPADPAAAGTQKPTGGVTPVAPTAAAAVTPGSKDPRRIYIVRGMTAGGRPGAPSSRLQVPIGALPPPPTEITPRLTETAIVLAWTPPAASPAAVTFNVYRGDEAQPLNAAPLSAATYEHQTTPSDTPECFRVRSVIATAAVSLEGPASAEQCVTPRDTFAPAAPKGLAAVATIGQINLIWEANTEKDVAGYLVLRGEAGADPVFAAITPKPIVETSFTDATVKPGVRYVYVIVAVDTATPPNTSPQSERREETAR